ncbi:MAG: DUF4166 domain-containing protein [Thioalkalispiraceae bacterium]|jgi:hypothetical protein
MDMQAKSKSFIDIIRTDLGESQWQKLDHAIITRFTCLFRQNTLRYLGTVNWIYCSPVGKLIAKLLKPFSLLPDKCARNSLFDFIIRQSNDRIYKQRRYFLDESLPFTFESTFKEEPAVHEEFPGGLGMYLKLKVKKGSLLFCDQGYFIRFQKWRIPLPRWLSVGHFELLHRNIDDRHFQVIIRIAHPLLGTLFYQRGTFFDVRSSENLATLC